MKQQPKGRNADLIVQALVFLYDFLVGGQGQMHILHLRQQSHIQTLMQLSELISSKDTMHAVLVMQPDYKASISDSSMLNLSEDS